MLKKIKALKVGESIRWEHPSMSSGMLSDYLNQNGKQFEVRFICTNWEASLGYTKVTRFA